MIPTRQDDKDNIFAENRAPVPPRTKEIVRYLGGRHRPPTARVQAYNKNAAEWEDEGVVIPICWSGVSNKLSDSRSMSGRYSRHEAAKHLQFSGSHFIENQDTGADGLPQSESQKPTSEV